MRVISLGWGVQSFTLAAMSALGELESVDFAIHADTTHEFSGTYAFSAKWTPWLEARGVKVVTVKNKRVDIVEPEYHAVKVPAFSYSKDGDGQTQRRCTGDWKIAPMRRYIQTVRNKEPVEQWIGISLDEWKRMKDSDVKYIKHRWPLIEKHMTRADCVTWLEAHGLEIPPKSACTFCPFHNTDEWRRVKANPADWAEAVLADREIRDVRMVARKPITLFLHPSRKPLEDVDLRTETEKGQLSLWDQECSGICGV